MVFVPTMPFAMSESEAICSRPTKVKSIVSSLIGGVASTNLGYGSLGMFKALPLIGPAMAIATLPLFASAITYAIGKVFIQHFESGGTFLDFEPERVKGYFQQQFGKGKAAAAAATA